MQTVKKIKQKRPNVKEIKPKRQKAPKRVVEQKDKRKEDTEASLRQRVETKRPGASNMDHVCTQISFQLPRANRNRHLLHRLLALSRIPRGLCD